MLGVVEIGAHLMWTLISLGIILLLCLVVITVLKLGLAAEQLPPLDPEGDECV